MDNVSELLFRNIEKGRGKSVAIHFEGQKITYADLADRANRVGNVLKSLNLPSQAVVMLLLYDSPDFTASFFGATKAGYIAAFANPAYQPEDYAFLLNNTQAKVLIADAELYAKVEPIRDKCPALEWVIVRGAHSQNTLSYENLVNQASNQLEVAPTKSEDPACIIFTSGSNTGQAKGVVHSHKNPLMTYETFGKHILQIQPGDITCSISKMFYAAGFGNSISFPSAVGASTLILPSKATPEIILDYIERYHPTILFAYPPSYLAMLNTPNAKKRNLQSVRLCMCYAEKLPKLLYKNWLEAFGLELIEALGTTEMLHIYLSNQPGKVNLDSLGFAVPGYEIKLIDSSEYEVKTNEIGRMIVRGMSAGLSYINNPEETKETMRDGWIYTQDLFKKDENGYFYLLGRTNEMFKSGGLWVPPIEVEQCLKEHPAVAECLVVPWLDADKFVFPKAIIKLHEAYQPTQELKLELQNLARSKLLPHKVPKEFEYVSDFPRTATGKIKRPKMDNLFSDLEQL